MSKIFKLERASEISAARLGVLDLSRQKIPTPVFMPIGTKGTVKTLLPQDIWSLGYRLMLGNTYHLVDRPGSEYLKQVGGLKNWNGWTGALLTDSGGFQAFSLTGARQFIEDGVAFKSVTDGRPLWFSPESVIDYQLAINSDIMMILDECPPLPSPDAVVQIAVERTTRWAERAMKYWQALGAKNNLFAIVQGGTNLALRKISAEALIALDFPGYAIGGLAVGEKAEERNLTVAATAPLLPSDKPRYLMGVGYPEDIVAAVKSGVDMFDCVIPTREARHGRVYRFSAEGIGQELWPGVWYETMQITRSEWNLSDQTLSAGSAGMVRLDFLRYLLNIGESAGQRLATLINLEFYFELMKKIRSDIADGKF